MEAWRQELYLQHHGIKGQRWGIRRFQNRDGTRTSAGKLKDQKENKKGLTDKQKKYIKRGAIIVGSIAAAAGTAYLIKTGKMGEAIKLGKDTVDKITGESQKREIESICKTINPGFDPGGKTNFHMLSPHDNAPLSHVNCVACTNTYELKRRGLDVQQANLIDTRVFPLNELLPQLYKDPKIERVNGWGSINKMKKQGRGNFVMYSSKMGGNHSIAYESVGKGLFKKLLLIDNQSGQTFNTSSIKSMKDFFDVYGTGSIPIGSIRTDNLQLNDMKTIAKFTVGKLFDKIV